MARATRALQVDPPGNYREPRTPSLPGMVCLRCRSVGLSLVFPVVWGSRCPMTTLVHSKHARIWNLLSSAFLGVSSSCVSNKRTRI